MTDKDAGNKPAGLKEQEPKMVNCTIDGFPVQVPEGTNILEAARKINIDIPTLCYLKDINVIGSCRLCLVTVNNSKVMQPACVYQVTEGMTIETNTREIRRARRINLELILSDHDRKCLTCPRNQNCELQHLAEAFNISEIAYEGEYNKDPIDNLSPSIVRDPSKCILCRRCVSVCKNVQTVYAIDTMHRGFVTTVQCESGKSLAEVSCVKCGQCIISCPVGALREKDSTKAVWSALRDPDMHVVVQPAPAVRVGLGEEFGMPIGTRVTGKMVAALRRTGFDAVFDTDTGADFTIMEEGTEFIHRLNGEGKLPQFTSCSPGWVKFCEEFYPEFMENISTAKSPHQMFGALIKTYYAQKKGLDPKKIFVVSLMPCTAKKYEAKRDEMITNGIPDVDAVITIREFAKMIRELGIDFANLPDEEFDAPFGEASGAGAIFAATGGVMEAALRTVSEVLTGKPLDKIDFTDIRGTDGIKRSEVVIGDRTLRVAVVSGLGNARKLLDAIKSGEEAYDFVEFMACPGGCVNGGGQHIVSSKVHSTVDIKALRAKAVYEEDASLAVRKSHENPIVIQVYKEFLGEPCGHKSHELLHVDYLHR